jgi:hypothetical protein
MNLLIVGLYQLFGTFSYWIFRITHAINFHFLLGGDESSASFVEISRI